MGSWFFMSSSSTLCRRLGKSFHGPCNLMSQSGEGGLLERRGVFKPPCPLPPPEGKQRKEEKEYKSTVCDLVSLSSYLTRTMRHSGLKGKL